MINAVHVKAFVPARFMWTVTFKMPHGSPNCCHGLLKANFIPSREQRDLLELTRQRSFELQRSCHLERREAANANLAGIYKVRQ